MTKSEIIQYIKADCGGDGFITLRDARRVLGVGHNTAVSVLEKYGWLSIGKTRRYFVPDVAEAFMELRRR